MKLSIKLLAEYYLEIGFLNGVIFYLLALSDSNFYLAKKEYQYQVMTRDWCCKSCPLMKKVDVSITRDLCGTVHEL